MLCVLTADKTMRPTMIRTYSELITLPTFSERYKYLQLNGKVGHETFGYDRYLNQALYSSPEWRRTRRRIIIRDEGRDLALDGYDIFGKIYIHHLNPITLADIEERRSSLFDHDNLVCVSNNTHDAIHYGDEDLLPSDPIIRRPNDTCPWKKAR